MSKIHELTQKHSPSVIELRRHFHQHPELSTQEFETQKRILQELQSLNIPCRPIAKTGVLGELTGSRPGKTIALRADIDALELTDQCGKSYQSQNPGVCHACGHDGHTAMLLGIAKVLSELREDLSGKIRFLFQPTEERFPGGALAMIEEGALEGVDSILGAHLWQPFPVGTIGISEGRLMASPDEFTIKIQGHGGHGSMPQQTIDAMLVGAQIVVALNTIISRNVDPLEQAVLSLGVFQSGDTFNIIPDSALIKGTVRSFEQTIRTTIFNRIETLVQGVCNAYGATFTMENFLGFPPVINTPAYAQKIAQIGERVLGPKGVLYVNPSMGGEDYSYYLEKVPGNFFFIGVGNPEKGIIYPQHHPKYDMDEAALAYGVEILATAAFELAQSK